MSAHDPDVWSRLADGYELQLPLERAALGAVVELLDPGPDDRLLDVATGTGAVLELLANHPAPPRRVVGIDSSERMLARALRVPGWELRQADAEALPFADGSFERITCCYLLHLLDPAGRTGVLAEIARVLAPGGLVGVVTVAPPRGRLERVLRGPVEALAQRSTGALAGLRSLDPVAELRSAGLEPLCGRRTRRGYPSLSVVARGG